MFVLGVIFLVLLIVPLMAAATIWAINTLFGLAIAYTWKTLLAAIILNTFWVTSGSVHRK